MKVKYRFLKPLLAGGFLSLSLSAYSAEIKVECTGADIFVINASYDSEKGTKELSTLKLAVEDKDTPKTVLADAKKVSATELRPGVVELTDLANSAMLEFVIDSKTFSKEGTYFFSGSDMNDVSIVAMPDGQKLANFALILGSKGNDGKRLGHLVPLDCK